MLQLGILLSGRSPSQQRRVVIPDGRTSLKEDLLVECCRGRREDLVYLHGLDESLLSVSDPPDGCVGCPFHGCCGVEERFNDIAELRVEKAICEPRDQIDVLLGHLEKYIELAHRGDEGCRERSETEGRP